MKIVIRLPNWLGDVVMSAAFVSTVREFYPDAVIDVIVKKELCFIASMMPGINFIHLFSKQENRGLPGVYRFGKKLRPEKYDLYFNLPGSLSSFVMGRATAAKNRIGFGSEGGFFLLTNSFKKPANVHRVNEYVSLIEQFTGKKTTAKAVTLTTGQPNDYKNGKVLVNFNSEAISRRMPVEKAKIILNLLTNTFRDTTFALIGLPNETDLVEEIINGTENRERTENLAGKTTLAGLADLIAKSTALLTTDSGPAHLANSLGTPVIALFGAGNEYNTAPYNIQNLTVLRYGQLRCEPCVKNSCRLYGIPKCMRLINDFHIINSLRVYLPHG